MKTLLFLFTLLLYLPIFAQEYLPEDLSAICYTWGINFPEHQQKDCKILKGPKRFNQQFEVLVKDKKDNYEVLAFFVPHSFYNGVENASVRSMIKATHFASNLENSNIAMHSLESTYARNIYGADWAAIYYFKPKMELSNYRDCQLVVLEKAGRGIFYTLYCFDEITEDVEEMIWNPGYLSDEK